MLAGFWRIFCAASAGLVLAAAAPAPKTATRAAEGVGQKPAPEPPQPTSQATPRRPASPATENACTRGRGDYSSQLCAEWKAADAAAESARWAKIGAGTSGLSVLAVLIALWLARQANRIAQDVGRKQLRAYLGFESVKLDRDHVLWISVRNFGQTPATDVCMETIHFDQSSSHPFGMIDPGSSAPGLLHLEAVKLRKLADANEQFRFSIKITYKDAQRTAWERTATYKLLGNKPDADGYRRLFVVGGTANEREVS